MDVELSIEMRAKMLNCVHYLRLFHDGTLSAEILNCENLVSATSQMWLHIVPDAGGAQATKWNYWNGECSALRAASCSGLSGVACSQAGQDFQGNVRPISLDGQTDHSGPAGAGDAARLPTANNGGGEGKSASDLGRVSEGYDD